MTQKLSLIFSPISWHNNCHIYSPIYNNTTSHLYSPSYSGTTIVTYILPHTMTQQLSLIFSLISYHKNFHLHFPSSWHNNLQLPTCHVHLYLTVSFISSVSLFSIQFPIKAPKHSQCLSLLHSSLHNTQLYSHLVIEFPWYSQKTLSRQTSCRPRFVFRRIGHWIS